MGIELKLFLGAIVIGIIGWIGYDLKTSHEEIGTLKTTVTAQKLEIDGWTKLEAKRKEGVKIDSDAGIAIDAAQNGVRASQLDIKTKVDEKVAAIREKYHPKNPNPQLPGNPAANTPTADENCLTAPPNAEEIEVATAQMEGVWEAYCHALPGEASCQPPPPTVPPVALLDEQTDQVALQ